MTLEHRATGWLDSLHHARVREALCHALGRFALLCPAYCLMPDHGHFLWLGICDESDHTRAVALFRTTWNRLLGARHCQLARQPFDRVLRPADRRRGAFMAVATYIWENPVRADLVAERREWPFSGAMIPGYPCLSPHDAGYWETFWRIHATRVENAVSRSESRPVLADPPSQASKR